MQCVVCPLRVALEGCEAPDGRERLRNARLVARRREAREGFAEKDVGVRLVTGQAYHERETRQHVAGGRPRSGLAERDLRVLLHDPADGWPGRTTGTRPRVATTKLEPASSGTRSSNSSVSSSTVARARQISRRDLDESQGVAAFASASGGSREAGRLDRLVQQVACARVGAADPRPHAPHLKCLRDPLAIAELG